MLQKIYSVNGAYISLANFQLIIRENKVNSLFELKYFQSLFRNIFRLKSLLKM